MKVDAVGSWTQEKLELLRQYLQAYTSILNTQKWCKGCHYVDAFAGGVQHVDKESGELIDGSPLLALQNQPPFASFIFIDRDEERINTRIKPLQKQFPDADIKPFVGDCNIILAEQVIPRFQGGKSSPYRGFIFLDPYGIDLAWETVQAIAKTQMHDVLINFSVMGVYRQLAKNKLPTEANLKKINRLMGTEDWFSVAYKPSPQYTLFDMGDNLERQSENLAKNLTNFYAQRLKTVFSHVSRPVTMYNSNGGPLYALILASHVQLAVTKMHEIFDRRKRSGRLRPD